MQRCSIQAVADTVPGALTPLPQRTRPPDSLGTDGGCLSVPKAALQRAEIDAPGPRFPPGQEKVVESIPGKFSLGGIGWVCSQHEAASSLCNWMSQDLSSCLHRASTLC